MRRSDHWTESVDRIIGSQIDFLVGTARLPHDGRTGAASARHPATSDDEDHHA
jgi:hypothetical protein